MFSFMEKFQKHLLREFDPNNIKTLSGTYLYSFLLFVAYMISELFSNILGTIF
jgi:hypothetical protein